MSQFSLPIDIAPNPKFPPGLIVRGADSCPGHRFVLRRAWSSGPSILWWGFNPSYADGARDDPSVLRMIGFSFRWGFGSMALVNWHSFVTPDPAKLRAWIAVNPARSSNNHRLVREELRKHEVCVAAWGNLIKEDELDRAMFQMFGFDPQSAWRCIGTTRSGAPTHPLARGRSRVPDSAVLKPWTYVGVDG